MSKFNQRPKLSGNNKVVVTDSTYRAETREGVLYATSARIRDADAYINEVINSDGVAIVRYVASVGEGVSAPRGYTVKCYPATRIGSETKSYTGGQNYD